MPDETEAIRRELVSKINNRAEPSSDENERIRLEQEYGQVWNTKELSMDFEVLGFMAPFIVVVRKSDLMKGTLMFQHIPRFYFLFTPSR